MNKNLKIAHLADIQIRRAIRHEEFRQVFSRTYKDLEEERPLRISLLGDIFHNKIDMSPNLIELAAEFFTNLSKIAPVDIIPGNHDLNLTQLSQGDSIKSIVSLLFNGVVVTQENKEEVDFSKKYNDLNGIYYYPNSGFYDIGNDIVYGHYSCIDGEILNLTKKESGKKYIALFHGMLSGSMNDNGSINNDTSLLKLSTFNNFDIVMMGDIHEHQSFRDDMSCAYSSSLLQNSYGESIDKGYIIWDLDTNSFRRKFILNDYGFAKIRLSQGELWEDRLSTIKFSNNKKKTKVYIEWQDFEENYSIEKENQLTKYIKDHYGCELVTVDFKSIFKDNKINDDESDADDILDTNIQELLQNWIKDNDENYDIDDSFIEELLELSKKVDAELELEDEKNYSNVYWYIKSAEVCNLFSYGNTPIKFDFEKLTGLTGVFGPNYSGKTNFIKSLMWGLFQDILGGGDPKKLVNIYTGNDKAYVNIYLNIGGVDYRIFRSVRNYQGRDGSVKVTYDVSYQIFSENKETGEMDWIDEINDKKTNDKRAVKELIIESIGTASDFSKVNLQSENGKDNYLNTDQPGKNDVISKYMGLKPYQDRYDYTKKKFNEITKEQKKLGDINEIQQHIKETKEKIDQDKNNLDKLEKEKADKQKVVDSINNKIIELNSLLEKTDYLSETNIDVVEDKIKKEKIILKEGVDKYSLLEGWLSENFRKELSETITEPIDSLISKKTSKEKEFVDFSEKLNTGNDWVKNNEKKPEIDTTKLESNLFEKKEKQTFLSNQLPSYRGEKCPTCSSVKKEAEPEKEKECLLDISKIKEEILSIEGEIKSSKDVCSHNILVDKALVRIQSVNNSLQSLDIEICELTRKIDFIEKTKDIVNHNKTYDDNHSNSKNLKSSIEQKKSTINDLEELSKKIKLNVDKIKKNKSVEILIQEEKENISQEKLLYQNIDRQTTEIFAELRVSNNSLTGLLDKIESIKEQEKQYKLYSLYLQAVHKDGIPSQIIKRKLPIINSKMKSILQNLVEYKIELYLNDKGDIKETFYYNDDKSDSLPMDSSSGAQGFLANLAIRDALHYASRLPKSSMCIIDEGFGKLDSNISSSMQQPLQYLKNKYKNVFVVTHTDIIKEFMDHIINVCKSRDGIPEEYKNKYENAWITSVDIN